MSNLFAFTDPCEPDCDMRIPLEVTPIYAQLRAEWDTPRYGTTWVEVLPDTSKFREQLKPLLKKGRKK